MKLNKLRCLCAVAVLGSGMISLPALAHDSVLHSMNALQDGLLHPFTGLDHLLAMLAIGVWATQQKHARAWLIPASFPLMMLVGGTLALLGIGLPGVEHGIAASVLVLGMLISFAVKLSVGAGVALVSVFAMTHGYAHCQEMPVHESAVLYGAGFVLATALIHAAGWFASNTAQKMLASKLPRFAGVMITVAGAFFLSSLE